LAGRDADETFEVMGELALVREADGGGDHGGAASNSFRESEKDIGGSDVPLPDR